MNKPREEEKEMYKCQSYYDDDNVLQDCTCGKCGEKSWEKEYNRKYAPLMAKIDEYYWQKGYPKLENDLRKFISQALSSQLKEVKKLITKTLTVDTTKMEFINDGKTRWERGREGIGIEPCIECSHANNIDKLLAEVEKLV